MVKGISGGRRPPLFNPRAFQYVLIIPPLLNSLKLRERKKERERDKLISKHLKYIIFNLEREGDAYYLKTCNHSRKIFSPNMNFAQNFRTNEFHSFLSTFNFSKYFVFVLTLLTVVIFTVMCSYYYVFFFFLMNVVSFDKKKVSEILIFESTSRKKTLQLLLNSLNWPSWITLNVINLGFHETFNVRQFPR